MDCSAGRRGWLRGSCGDADDGAIACGAGVAIVAGEEVFEERVDFLMLDASELDVFVEGEIAGAARVSGGMKSSDGFEPDAVEVVARLLVWHGRRNLTTGGWGCNGTLVLRRGGAGSRGGK